MSAAINIHSIQSTRQTLNDRFTAMGQRPRDSIPQQHRRSRSRSRGRSLELVGAPPRATVANRRLVQQLDRREKIQAALKLKRRSMKAVGSVTQIRRGSIRALRAAPSGRTVKANSLARVATMKADLIGYNNNNNNNSVRSRSFRRSGSLSGRLGNRRSEMGGAAQRIARRQLERGSQRHNNRRSRSRSRARAPMPMGAAPIASRRRSMSRGRIPAQVGGRVGADRRGRSRSRSRVNLNAGARSSLPIKARLGVRPGTANSGGASARIANRRRNRSMTRRGVTDGRVQKKSRNMTGAGQRTGGNVSSFKGRARGRMANAGGASRRSRSRTRKVGEVVGQQLQQQLKQKRSEGGAGTQRGRSVQRRGRGGQAQQRKIGNSKNANRNGQQRNNGTGNRVPKQNRGQQRNGGGRGRTGRPGKPAPVKREDLDQELDQYMSTPNTDVDYLLKN